MSRQQQQQQQKYALGCKSVNPEIVRSKNSRNLTDMTKEGLTCDPMCKDAMLINPDGTLIFCKISDINYGEMMPKGCTFLLKPKIRPTNVHLHGLRKAIGPYVFYELQSDCTVRPLIIEEGQSVMPFNSDAILIRLGMFLILFLKEISEQYLSDKLVPEKFMATLLILQYWQQIVKLKGSDSDLSKIFCNHLPSLLKACREKNNILPLVIDLIGNLDKTPKPAAAAAAAPDPDADVDITSALNLMLFFGNSVKTPNVLKRKLFEMILFMFYVVNTANHKDINVSDHINILQRIKDKVSAILNGIVFTDDEFDNYLPICIRLFKREIDQQHLYNLLSANCRDVASVNLMHYVGHVKDGKPVVRTTTYATPFDVGQSVYNNEKLTNPVVYPLQPGSTGINFNKSNVTLGLITQVNGLPGNQSFYTWFLSPNNYYDGNNLKESPYEPGSNGCNVILDKKTMTVTIGGRGEGQQKIIQIKIGECIPVCVITYAGIVNVDYTPEAEVVAASAAAAPGIQLLDVPGEPLPDAPGGPLHVAKLVPDIIISADKPLLPADRIKYLADQLKAKQQKERMELDILLLAAERDRAKKEQQQAQQEARARQMAAAEPVDPNAAKNAKEKEKFELALMYDMKLREYMKLQGEDLPIKCSVATYLFTKRMIEQLPPDLQEKMKLWNFPYSTS
uniref:Uncharacterized protein n=1 Tax=viral metagenome TaxID=1070528 RepID=A0A6C0BG87_9ZZZZ